MIAQAIKSDFGFYIFRVLGDPGAGFGTSRAMASLCAEILDFGGSDSSRVASFRGRNPLTFGGFVSSFRGWSSHVRRGFPGHLVSTNLSTVGIVLVGRSGVADPPASRARVGGASRGRVFVCGSATPNLPTKTIPTKIRLLNNSGKFPVDMRVPPHNSRFSFSQTLRSPES